VDCLLIADNSAMLANIGWFALAIVGLGFVIFVHELGHFLVAKACGVKCEKFYVGFDFFDIKIGDRVIVPRSLLKWKWGETEYGIGIVPLGGYVKMLGQDDNPGNMEKELQRSKRLESDAGDEAAPIENIYDRSQLDPRSYLAKSVPQRMAIISAGVIFNVIFAIIFAAIAFKSGVYFEPPVVGSVITGSPAWKEDLTGATITRIGQKPIEGYFTFLDLAQEVVFEDEGKPLELEFTRPGSSETFVAAPTPEKGLREDVDWAMLGFDQAYAPIIGGGNEPTLQGQPAHDSPVKFRDGDKIVQVEERSIENIFELRRALAIYVDRDVDFVVERNAGDKKNPNIERVTIPVSKNPRRETGLSMKWGPVTAIQKGSPAERAGFQVGDEVLEIDGRHRGDLATADQRLALIARDNPRELEFGILRDGKKIEIRATPRIPRDLRPIPTNYPAELDSLGLAIATSRIVEDSRIDGIQAGDEVVKVELYLADNDKEWFARELKRDTEFDLSDDENKLNWYFVDDVLQILPGGTEFAVTVSRDGQNITRNHSTKTSDNYFISTRGIKLTPLQHYYQSTSWIDAFKNGALQTWSGGQQVWKFLGKLVRRELSPRNLGGPGIITYAATSEASQGPSRLLLFLTLLSVNLAIVNFLPLPVLDGGHMMFLAYEGLFRRPVNEKVQLVLTYAGLFMILGLMLFVIFLDVERFSKWFGT
jgi:regulator of sigma E protease